MKYILIFAALLSYGALASEFDDTKVLAEQGDAKAQFDLGLTSFSNQNLPDNYEQAAYWLLKAAKQNYPSAQ